MPNDEHVEILKNGVAAIGKRGAAARNAKLGPETAT
jgi:hypothetical protein